MTTYSDATDSHHYRARYNPAFLRTVIAKRERESRERALFEEQRLAEECEQEELAAAALIDQYRVAVDNSCPSDALVDLPEGRVSAVTIIRAIARSHGVTWKEITSGCRIRHIVAARQTAMYEVRTRRPDLSLPQIGRLFGGRDHTTVLHAIRKIEAQRAGEQR